MLEVVVLSMIILTVCTVMLCIRIIIRKDGKFPDTHVGGNPALGKKGIGCARTQDFEAGLRMNLFERLERNV
ncbi:MAG: hypothetical protein LBJ47_02510 [Tannerella sp.]|jgi:hypothetical protein|nr:hypothetical protein [Tannerella sp.]